jgi:predicted MFS family arabinose efflux permease
MAQPALMALVADRASEAERGRAISTFYAGWESGIGVGAYLLGHLLTWAGFTIVFWTGALVVSGGGVASVLLYGRSGHRPGAPIS